MDRISVFMEEESLTCLRILHNWKTGKFGFIATKDWEDVTWRDYNREFTFATLLSPIEAVGGSELLGMMEDYGLKEHIEHIKELIRAGKHEGIEYFHNGTMGISFVHCMHSSRLAVNNSLHVIRAGGIRRHNPGEDEKEIILDGLNLARAMSYKNAAGDIPVGGSKIVVVSDPIDTGDLDRIGFMAYCLDRTRTLTGPDMGFTPEHADVMGKYTRYVTGGTAGRLGPTGIAAAYGVFLALREAVRFRFGQNSLRGITVAVQGVGALGYALAGHLIKAGADLIIADPDETRIARIKREYRGKNIDVVEPEEIYTVDARVFSPCAVGGVITEDRIKDFNFEIIIGGANNQLSAKSREEEIELSRKLQDEGILFQIDWMHNIGGVLSGWEEFISGENAGYETVKRKIEVICGDGTRKNLEMAEREGLTPTEMAYKTVESKIF